MKIEKVFVEFCGCPTTDKIVGPRRSSIEKFESDFPEIEVIEFVAKWKYDELQSKLAIAVEALEFYSNPDNWRVNPDYSHEYDVIDSDDTYVSGAELHKKSNKVLEVHSGGKKSRQALEKIR